MVEEKGAEGESDENVCKLGKVIRVTSRLGITRNTVDTQEQKKGSKLLLAKRKLWSKFRNGERYMTR